MQRTSRLAIGPIAIISLAVSLTACTPPDDTESAPEPTAVWSSGAPAGALDDDPWVVATRASLEAQAVARNRNDFSLASLAATTGYDLQTRLFAAAGDRLESAGQTQILPGPTPFAPTEVEAAGDGGSATVRGCIAQDWASDEGTVPDDLDPRGVEYQLEQDGDRTLVTGSRSLSSLDCSSIELPVALFEPAPDPSTVDDPGQIVRPVKGSAGSEDAG